MVEIGRWEGGIIVVLREASVFSSPKIKLSLTRKINMTYGQIVFLRDIHISSIVCTHIQHPISPYDENKTRTRNNKNKSLSKNRTTVPLERLFTVPHLPRAHNSLLIWPPASKMHVIYSPPSSSSSIAANREHHHPNSPSIFAHLHTPQPIHPFQYQSHTHVLKRKQHHHH